MTRRIRTAAALALLASLAALGGCSSSDQDAVHSTADSAAQEVDAGAGTSAADADAGPGARAAAAPARTTVAQRAVIATATVALHSDDVRAARNDVQQVADALRGEVADEEADSSDGELVWTRLVLRVPTARFADAITRLEEIGELDSTERDTEDVTTQVIDNEARIRAQERSLRRIEVLLDRADRIADIVSIESELTRRQSDLDSLKQQRAWLADQTSMSTITVHVERTAAGATPETEESGFLSGLASGWDGLSAAAVALATLAGLLLPWAVVALALGLPLWWLARRGPRSGRSAAEPPAQPLS
ncbi:DUF4349 domain-containing protein [Nocardioides houyundeii]|uniref:DUF4349 domain-containing protein n=1 Tax=Nocardioides houyundeii TaxID=2045452 RepID=UPI000DF12553|nr:DUF4349 domain-containing protein [Nocardioides houyundeii]